MKIVMTFSSPMSDDEIFEMIMEQTSITIEHWHLVDPQVLIIVPMDENDVVLNDVRSLTSELSAYKFIVL